MAIDPNNPFDWTYPPNQNYWGTGQLSSPNAKTEGGTASQNGMSVGVFNTADNFASLSLTATGNANNSPYNVNNSESGYTGPGNSYLGPQNEMNSATQNEINNAGSSGQNGPDSFGDVTVVNTAVAFDATFAAIPARALSVCTVVAEVGLRLFPEQAREQEALPQALASGCLVSLRSDAAYTEW
jgi:hypothetical protein